MKNSANKRALAVLMAAAMVLEGSSSISVKAQEDSVLSYQVTSDTSENGYIPISEGEELTISQETKTGYYCFTPEKSGFYRISKGGEDYISVGVYQDLVSNEPLYNMYPDLEAKNTEEFYLKQGNTYYINVYISYGTGLTFENTEYSSYPDSIVSAGKSEDVQWSLNAAGLLQISGTGEIKSSPWSSSSDHITKVIIENGITGIGANLFAAYGNSNLESITIPETVKSIGANAFYGTLWLQNMQKENPLVIVNNIVIDGTTCEGNVVIPDGVVAIGDMAFQNWSDTNLTGIQIPESVVSIGESAFMGCKELEKIEYTGEDNVSVIGNYAFSGTGLKEFSISSNLKEIGSGAFWGCESLENITFLGENNLSYIGVSAFGDTAWYKNQGQGFVMLDDVLLAYEGEEHEITIPANVKRIGVRAFSGNENIQKVEMTENITEIWEYGFETCSSLKEIVVPQSVAKIAYNAFDSCTALENAIVEDGVSEIEKEVFINCGSLNQVTIPQSVTSIGENAIGYKYDTSTYTIVKADKLPTIQCYKESTAYQYAVDNEIPYEIVDSTEIPSISPTVVPTSTPIITPTVVPVSTPVITSATLPSENPTVSPTGIPTATSTPMFELMQIHQRPQTIVAQNITKTYGAKSFSIGAQTDGDGTLTYTSADKKVVTVSNAGKITIKGCGKTTITIKAAGTEEYRAAEKKITITIKPKKQKVSSLKSTKAKTITVKWEKDTKATGYILQYATDKNFKKNVKNITISSNKTTSKEISKLKAGKKYYVRVCSYKKSSGGKIQGSYSGVKSVKVKK